MKLKSSQLENEITEQKRDHKMEVDALNERVNEQMEIIEQNSKPKQSKITSSLHKLSVYIEVDVF